MKSKSHRISIPSILESGPNSIEKLGYLLKREGFRNIGLFYDEIIYNLFGEKVDKVLRKENINYIRYVLGEMDQCSISEKAFSISKDVDAFLALGGGKVIDSVKYMGFLRKTPFICVPTSTSNDGFSSPVASLYIGGRRTTVPAKIPYGIVVDTNIIKTAPDKFIYSGIGDLISNLTALWDWKFEERNGRDRVDDFAVMISRRAVNSFLHLAYKTIKDDFFIQNLVDCLIMNGIAMEISGSSAPSSGSEHLISHSLDKILKEPYLHGVQVGIATYIISKVQDNNVELIDNLFTNTGFWQYAESLKITKADFIEAVDLAPSIKPQRLTTIHIEENREKIKEIIMEMDILK